MRVVVAGGHGKIGLRLLGLLAAGGHEPVGLIRRDEQAADIRAAGAEPLVLDLEAAEDVSLDADAVVFAAGAGPGGGGGGRRGEGGGGGGPPPRPPAPRRAG